MKTQRQAALQGIITEQMQAVAQQEGLEASLIRDRVAKGTIAIPANINHRGLVARGVGEGLSTKVNANIGTSSAYPDPAPELDKLKAAIDAGVPMVMVGHLTAPNAFGSDVPASLNPAAVTDLLRGELGFQGLVITDSLSMGAVGDFCTPDQAGVAALEAGADLVLMPEDFAAAYQGVLDAVNEGALSEERIDQSVLRIAKAKLAFE